MQKETVGSLANARIWYRKNPHRILVTKRAGAGINIAPGGWGADRLSAGPKIAGSAANKICVRCARVDTRG